MPTISSDLVQQLRSKTGAGMMECKRALETASGDIDQAIKILREKGAASAAKRAGRSTADGLVTSHVEGKTAVLLELNCETDFVARTDDFLSLIGDLAKGAATSNWKTPADVPQGRIQEMVAKLGENINLRRFVRFDREPSGLFAVYIHPTGNTGKIGVLIELSATNEKAASAEETKNLARELAMQVAAASPRWVSRENVSAEIVEQEKAIGREQAKRENKPEKIWDKIVDGKLQQFYQQFCLLEQPFIKDSAGKTLIKTVLEQVSAKVGGALAVKRFARYKVGEEE